MAKANSTARSLTQISETQGWDSTKVWDQDKGAYTESILGWDHPREPFSPSMGEIPGGVPQAPAANTSAGPTMDEKVTFNVPDAGRESRENGKPKMTLSDPEPGNTY